MELGRAAAELYLDSIGLSQPDRATPRWQWFAEWRHRTDDITDTIEEESASLSTEESAGNPHASNESVSEPDQSWPAQIRDEDGDDGAGPVGLCEALGDPSQHVILLPQARNASLLCRAFGRIPLIWYTLSVGAERSFAQFLSAEKLLPPRRCGPGVDLVGS